MKIIVERGDSISSIAKALNTTPEEIKRINKLTTGILSIGEELIINEDKKIEKINCRIFEFMHKPDKVRLLMNKINEIIDYLEDKNE